jgi:hypothetical protein
MRQRSDLPSAQSQLQQLLPPKNDVAVAAEVEIAIAQVPVAHDPKVQIPTRCTTILSQITKMTLMILRVMTKTRRRPLFASSCHLGLRSNLANYQTRPKKVA